MDSLYWLVAQREKGLLPEKVFARGIRDSPYLVKRLANTRVLKGHHGCVNTVSWSDTGSRLISGSDDCHLNIYDITTGLVCHSFHTSHQSNIFSAKFLPLTGDYKAVSCAGIGSVEVSEITPYGEYLGHQFKCQTSITYQVATSPGCPHEFMTCEERGMVRIYDLRTCSSCHCDSDCNRSILCRFPSAVTSMAVHPLEPHYIVVGLGDGTIRLLDRRRADYWQKSSTSDEPLFLGASCSLVKYQPASLKNQRLKITSVNFNHSGTEVLASYSEDYVYLFNSGLYGVGPDITLTPHHVTKPRYLSQCERYPGGRHESHKVTSKPMHLREKFSSSQQSTRSSDAASSSSVGQPSTTTVPRAWRGRERGNERAQPAVKRIRIRGDWSDTGPDARPETPSEPVQGGGLMNRMSRMFSHWVNMSLDGVSGAEEEGDGEGERDEEGEGERDGVVGGEESGEEGERREREGEHSSDDTTLFLSSESEPARVRADEEGSSFVPHAGDPRLYEDNSGMDDAVQEATERAMHRAVQEAMDRAVDEAMDRAVDDTMDRADVDDAMDRAMNFAVDRAVDDAMDGTVDDAMEDALDRVVDKAMDGAVDDAVDRAVDRATDRVVDNAADRAMDRTVDDAIDKAVDCAMDRAMNDEVYRLVDAAEDINMDDVMKKAVDDAVDKAVDDAVDKAVDDAMHRVAMDMPVSDTMDRSKDKAVGRTTDYMASAGDAGPVDRTHETVDNSPLIRSSHPTNVPSRLLVADVRENSPASLIPSTSGDRSCDQSYDKSHDHSYRRSRFKVQRRRLEKTVEREEVEEDAREDSIDNRLKGWSTEEEKEEVDRRLMRETARSVHNHLQPFMVYKGHRNARTMIKQANFFGDDWVLSGSDCGRVFVWDKWTGEVVNMFTADSHVVNCVQPHPAAHMIATSGIDYNVKLWEPVAANEASLSDLNEVVRRNEQMLQESRNTVTIPSSFLLRILAYLNRTGRMRRSSDQQEEQPPPPHNESD